MQDASDIVSRARELLPNAQHVELLKYFEGGWSNRNFLLRIDEIEAVMRLKNPLSAAPDLEFMYLENALSPPLLAYDRTSGDMVTEFVEGELLVNSPITPHVAAAFMHDLHAEIPKGIQTYRAEPAIERFLEGLRLPETLESIYRNLRWEPQRICGCHNELNDWNVIKTATGFCTLDWESAGDNDPIFDVVGLCYGLEFSDEDFHTCIQAYDPNADPEHVLRTRILYQVREHAWALDRLRHGAEHEGIVKQKHDTAIEIQRLSTELS